MRHSIVNIAIAAALLALASPSRGGGFGIATQSGSGTGNAFAGAAAAEDASTVWFNPAGMSYLPAGRHIALAAHALRPSFKFGNGASNGAFAAPGSGEGGDGGHWEFVPQAFLATDLGRDLKLGFALNVPFGLSTQYDPEWRGRLTTVKSEIAAVNVNGAVAYRVSDRLAVGAGVSWQTIEAELTNFAGAAGTARVKATDNAWGINFGVMLSPTQDTRMGLHYRSSIGYRLDGDVSFSMAAAGNGRVAADLRVPESVSFSFFAELDPRWDLMADVTWTRWSRLKQLSIVRTDVAPGVLLSVLPLNWRDTTRFSFGASYKPNASWKIRLGLAFDPTPTNDIDRSPRLPDHDRLWAAFGIQCRLSRASTLEFGYAHEFVRDAKVNVPVPGAVACAAGCLNGTFEDKVDILSLQINHRF